MLASLVQNVLKHTNVKLQQHQQQETTDSSHSRRHQSRGGGGGGESDLIILSNDDPNQAKLDFLLGKDDDEGRVDDEDEVKVDITLRTQPGRGPIIMLLFTTPATAAPQGRESPMVSMSIEVGINGRVSITNTMGMWGEKESVDVVAVQRKMERVLEISQDLGTLVEWSLRWIRQRNKQVNNVRKEEE